MRPGTESEVAEIVRGANGPLSIRGGGTRGVGVGAGDIGAGEAGAGEVLDIAGLAGITLYEPGALTLVARAGTPVAEVQAALAADGQRLAFEVPDMRGLLGTRGASTIGGVVAANASGPRRVTAGAARDFLLGVRFVDGRGVVVKNGGRVMKNVTGYDLVKLLAGSRGTLGVLTEVSLKVLPVPEMEATLVARGLGVAGAVAAMAAALGSPFDVTGAAHLTDGDETRVRIEGLAGSVAYRTGRLLALLGPRWEVVEGAENLWHEVRDVVPFHQAGGAVWRLHLKPSDAPGVLATLGGRAVIDWGGALAWLHLPEARVDIVRSAVAAVGGHATLWRGAGGPVFPPEAPAVAALSRGLRAEFDPRGILNPGLMEA